MRKLPLEVQTVLRTGVTLTDITQCVVELVHNSLDANSTSIAVRIDLENFTLQVVDNGNGLTKEELELVGTRYMTSKIESLKDLEKSSKYYGFRGEALASLRQSCGVVMILSRAKGNEETLCKVFRANKENQKVTPSVTKRLCAGTTVVVKDLLYNLPVRRSRVQPGIQLEEIRHALLALSIINYKVSFTLRNDVTKLVILQTQAYQDVSDAMKHHCNLKEDHLLVPVSARVPPFKVLAHISRETEHSKRFQFIYVNRRRVKNKAINKLLNKRLSKSFYLRNIGKEIKNFNDKTKDKFYPVFVIIIKCPCIEYDITFDPRKLLVEFRNWDIVNKCLEKIVDKFVSTEVSLNKSSKFPSDQQNHKIEIGQTTKEHPLRSTVVFGASVKRTITEPHTKNEIQMTDQSNLHEIKTSNSSSEPEVGDKTSNNDLISVVKKNDKPSEYKESNNPIILNRDNKDLKTVCPLFHSSSTVLRETPISKPEKQSITSEKRIYQSTINKKNSGKTSISYDKDSLISTKTSNEVSKFRMKQPSCSQGLQNLEEHILTESESNKTPIKKSAYNNKVTKTMCTTNQSIVTSPKTYLNMKKPVLFKIPNQDINDRKRKSMTEHILTESESDEKSLNNKSTWNSTISREENHMRKSILPIRKRKSMTEHILTESESDEKSLNNKSTWNSAISRKENHTRKSILPIRKRKSMTEHILTESESDEKSLNNKSTWNSTISRKENHTRKSILPIQCPQFFKDTLKTMTLANDFWFPKSFSNETSPQRLHIDLYRSVKENLKANTLKYTQKNVLTYLDNGKCYYFNGNKGTKTTLVPDKTYITKTSKNNSLISTKTSNEVRPSCSQGFQNLEEHILTESESNKTPIKKSAYNNKVIRTICTTNQSIITSRKNYLNMKKPILFKIPNQDINDRKRKSMMGHILTESETDEKSLNNKSTWNSTSSRKANHTRKSTLPIQCHSGNQSISSKIQIDHSTKRNKYSFNTALPCNEDPLLSLKVSNQARPRFHKLKNLTEHILTESESGNTPMKKPIYNNKVTTCQKNCSGIKNSFQFKIPNQIINNRKRKLTEHILTETESDEISLKKIPRWNNASSRTENATRKSILPIQCPEFFNDTLKTMDLATDILFPKTFSSKTPFQRLHIDFYRSVKEDYKANTLPGKADKISFEKNTYNNHHAKLNNEFNPIVNTFKEPNSIVPSVIITENNREIEETFLNHKTQVADLKQNWRLFSPAFRHVKKSQKSRIVKRKPYPTHPNPFVMDLKSESRTVKYKNESFIGHEKPFGKKNKFFTNQNPDFPIMRTIELFKSKGPKKISSQNINDFPLRGILKHSVPKQLKISSKQIQNLHGEIKRNNLFSNSGRFDNTAVITNQWKESLKPGSEQEINNISFKSNKHIFGPDFQFFPKPINKKNKKNKQNIFKFCPITNGVGYKQTRALKEAGSIAPLNTRKMENSPQYDKVSQYNSYSYNTPISPCSKYTNMYKIFDTEKPTSLEPQKNEIFKFHSSNNFVDKREVGDKNSRRIKAEIKNLFTEHLDHEKVTSAREYKNKTISFGLKTEFTKSIFNDTPFKFSEHRPLNSSKNTEIGNENLNISEIINSINKLQINSPLTESCNIKENNEKHNVIHDTSDQAQNEKFSEIRNIDKLSNNIEIELPQLATTEPNIDSQTSCRETVKNWSMETMPNGQVIYINGVTGMSSFSPPMVDKSTYVMNKRHWFMPKGTSPLLLVNVEANAREIKQLTDTEKDAVQNILTSNNTSDLASVKWENIKMQDKNKVLEMLDEVCPNREWNSQIYLQKSCSFSSDSIKNAKVIGQVDNKFIAALLKSSEGATTVLVLFDQHAVDERIRVESLTTGYKQTDGQLICQSLNPPVEIPLSENDRAVLIELLPRISKLGLSLKVDQSRVTAFGIPLCLFNRTVRESGDDVLVKMTIALIKQILMSAEDFRGVIPSLPNFLSDIINSEACRGAIKFGDVLSLEKCNLLVSRLALCNVPFQCAHGRPVLAVIMEHDEAKIEVQPINFGNLLKWRNSKKHR